MFLLGLRPHSIGTQMFGTGSPHAPANLSVDQVQRGSQALLRGTGLHELWVERGGPLNCPKWFLGRILLGC